MSGRRQQACGSERLRAKAAEVIRGANDFPVGECACAISTGPLSIGASLSRSDTKDYALVIRGASSFVIGSVRRAATQTLGEPAVSHCLEGFEEKKPPPDHKVREVYLQATNKVLELQIDHRNVVPGCQEPT